MDSERNRCRACRGLKTAFFSRAPIRMGAVFAALLAAAVALVVEQDPGLRLVLTYACAVTAGLLLGSTYRLRCLRCEPQWRNRIWHRGR